ncbi:trypsin-like peptidase domain-containing protein [Ramlibacter sp.]|uniref:trypsin-like peptidase domain-containing protein n=1 Tax=Ramlibacter sp. TaxID=1917967 RepID=UPI002B61D5DD|nr:trypsin-like peptidase domain-containing protein [Ramlibacter sp.]HWI83304.1 trypsin-like peptidase domain-containing protein [Ramlibacter sp.]
MNRLLAAAAWCACVVIAGCGGGGQDRQDGPAPAAGRQGAVEPMTLGAAPGAESAPAIRRAATDSARVTLDAVPAEAVRRRGKPDDRRRIGVGRDVAPTDTPGKTHAHLAWRPTPAGGMVGAIAFESQPAQGLRLGVLVQRLPADAVLRFYAPASAATLEVPARDILGLIRRNEEAGDTTAAGRTYWSPQVEGARITMEVELPPGIGADAVALSVPRLSHLFASPLAPSAGENLPLALGQSSSCEVDVTCHPYGAESNSVARMSYVGTDGGSYWCSGTLLNDRVSSGTPWFLTANHCVSRQTVASTLETHWFLRSASCNSGVTDPANRVLRGGATLLYASSTTDTSFLRLAATPPAGVTYAAWSPDALALGSAVAGIHHPRGDLQKISFGSVAEFGDCRVTDPSGAFSCTQASPSSAAFVDVRNTSGITEGGSSGSALFRTIGAARYVVGQLYGGNASCTNSGGSNFYGRFDVAYNAALHQWLDGGASVTLAVSRAGSGQGSVASAPAGISCGSSCAAPFTRGATVTLSAQPAPGSTFGGWSGACSGTGPCVVTMSGAQSVVATFSVATVALAAALDNTSLAWTSGGNAPFAAQNSIVSYGAAAAQSGAIGSSQSSWLATTVTGPGMLTFDWKVSSEANYDFLTVSLDGVKQLAWSGETDWYTSSVSIPAGVHTVRWQYTKDALLSSGRDAGWVDHVVFVADATARDVNRVFTWAEFAYPGLFKGPPASGTYQDYTYRYYPGSGNYLGVRDGRVYVHNGASWNFLDVGAFGDYLTTASTAGF